MRNVLDAAVSGLVGGALYALLAWALLGPPLASHAPAITSITIGGFILRFRHLKRKDNANVN